MTSVLIEFLLLLEPGQRTKLVTFSKPKGISAYDGKLGVAPQLTLV